MKDFFCKLATNVFGQLQMSERWVWICLLLAILRGLCLLLAALCLEL